MVPQKIDNIIYPFEGAWSKEMGPKPLVIVILLWHNMRKIPLTTIMITCTSVYAYNMWNILYIHTVYAYFIFICLLFIYPYIICTYLLRLLLRLLVMKCNQYNGIWTPSCLWCHFPNWPGQDEIMHPCYTMSMWLQTVEHSLQSKGKMWQDVARCSKLLLTHEKKLLEIEQARCQQRDVFQNLLDSTLNHQEQMESKARSLKKANLQKYLVQQMLQKKQLHINASAKVQESA